MALRLFFFYLAILLGAGQLQAQENQDLPELREYIQLIRETGMTELAQSTLRHTASIRVGASEVFFLRDSLGSYNMGYRSLTCPNPEADAAAVEAMKREWKEKTDPEVSNLRWLADADSSGFVTTAEAMELRRLIEFGYKAAHVVSEEGRDMKTLCQAFNCKEENMRLLLDAYGRLQEKAKRGKIAPFPEVAAQ